MTPQRAFCPGKLILGGEHAVVQGRPALAMAVSRGVKAEWTPGTDDGILLDLPNQPTRHSSRPPLQGIAEGVEARHRDFLAGSLPVHEVAPTPEDLLLTALHLANPTGGGQLRFTSTLPMGAGLGSSAAFLISLFRALRPGWDSETLFQAALTCEHYQHGRSSGLDIAVCLHGGGLWVENGSFHPLPSLTPPPFQLYLSGRPASSTGECVAAVSDHFPREDPIWECFESATRSLREAIEGNNKPAFREAIQIHHALLCRIGVVPIPVQEAISLVAAVGGAAKICGAGSLKGTGAGVVLVTGGIDLPVPRDWERLL